MTPFPHKLFEVSKIMGKLTGSVFHRAGQHLVLGACGNLLIGGETRNMGTYGGFVLRIMSMHRTTDAFSAVKRWISASGT
ncbi:MAG: hypothetical protein KAV99_08180, partial [Candidatus Latescibacteria bacterium]|nr:hypothetical protein [Candidatus Latescibacterota bacterium]